MNRHRDPTFATSFPEVGKWPIHVQVSHYATIAIKRIGRKKQAKKPTDDEINQARVSGTNMGLTMNFFFCLKKRILVRRIKYSIRVCLEIH